MSARRSFTLLLAALLLLAYSAPMAAASKQAKLNKKYQALVDEADALWAEYKKADKNFFEKGKSDFDKHLAKLADIQDRLTALHTKWIGMETPDAVGTSDFKVGLALELQIAAIGAEVVGLLEDDQDYMNLSTELDKQYEAVVADL